MILTAHHTDDLIENFFIRLLRGSGLKGLISFSKIKSKVTLDNKIFILRPLLDTPKKDLIYLDVTFEQASKFIVSAGTTNIN